MILDGPGELVELIQSVREALMRSSSFRPPIRLPRAIVDALTMFAGLIVAITSQTSLRDELHRYSKISASAKAVI